MQTDYGMRQAICYPELTGYVHSGETVILNTTAVEMKLGTGGMDFIVHIEREPSYPEPPGHIFKLRYTPLQTPVLAVEAPESPWHKEIAAFSSLGGTPVVCAELHSQLAAIAFAIHHTARKPVRVVYIMTDGAALPLALSRMVSTMLEKNLIQATITCGQAFGGDLEAVNLYSALAAAKVAVKADIIIVCQGPGGVGTSTSLGFSGIEQGSALNAVSSLGGYPIAAVRLSGSDPRKRHRGISHHTLTVLQTVTLCSAHVALPEQKEKIEGDDLIDTKHEIHCLPADDALEALLNSGITVNTMGRTIMEDSGFFLAACAAGQLAASTVSPDSD